MKTELEIKEEIKQKKTVLAELIREKNKNGAKMEEWDYESITKDILDLYVEIATLNWVLQ